MKHRIKLLVKEKDGSIAVEASFAIIIFIFAFMSVLSLCKVGRTQIIIQHAINQVSREISQYSYIAGKLGLNKDVTEKDNFINDTDNLINQAVDTINVLKCEGANARESLEVFNFNEINSIEEMIKSLKSYEDLADKLKESYENIETSANLLVNTMKEYFNDPRAILKGFLMVAEGELTDFAVSRFITAPMAEVLVSKYISNDKQTADKELKRLGIEQGLDGLNFNLSTIFADGKTINITVIYKIRVSIPLLMNKELVCKLNSSTLGLGVDGSNKKLINNDGSNNSNNNMINIWDYGGEKTTNEFIKIIKKERNLKTVRLPVSLDFYDQSSSTLTYVHSMNTEKKSYTENGILKLNVIKSKIKYYCKAAISSINKIDKIILDDSTEFNLDKGYSCKVLMVLQQSAYIYNDDILQALEEIKRELGNEKLDIEIYYSDGFVNAD